MNKPNQQTGFMKQEQDKIPSDAQYGGTILGFIFGLAVGLGIAFVIAFYLSKNTPQERPGVRAPNLPLTIKPSAAPTEGEPAAPVEPLDLNKPLQGKAPAPASSDPIGDLVNGKKSADTAATPTPKTEAIYFLQVGAFAKRADADAQKATLAIQGIQTQLSELTSDGNTLWRVRTGPYNSVDESNAVRDKLSGMGIKPTLIKTSK
ncbi:sporulation protein [Polynucleobacter asymbioticus]|uniref:Sporulation domain protein n=3 Tax=Polynucleobacter asymbioticus TaxID=576611 RepID=A4T0C4_POLAQ|nr:Sporulation domain protein [Polynucleobacter asymbioticus QLW-P1DMWA-1]APC00114.1 sporulation protein [Polynucleobacter asymbioticus]APC02422.1 sporulation protein [Polynucleobacter asymbioticus]APC07184.1 sporulation protein [Polynucleobacter asymbioticus]